MTRSVKNSVAVITGASSGIGRATALEFAKQGATVLLAARREAALQTLAAECEHLGGKAIALPTDVTQEDAVQAVAKRAIDTFGRLDVWVNNAAVSLFARFEETPPAAFRQVIETNLFGYVYGARAALPYFREQGSGVLVNVASVVGIAAQPYTSAYVISKFAIRGLSESLRMELQLDNAPNIHVCTVLPATIDTPIFRQAANYTGRQVKGMDPVYSAERVAGAIADLVPNPKREIIVGDLGNVLVAQSMLVPDLHEPMFARQVDQSHFDDHKPAPVTEGNLFEPMPEHATVSGDWKQTGELKNLLPWQG